METLTGDEATVSTSQEDKARRNLRRLTRPPHRRSELILSLGTHSRRNERSPNCGSLSSAQSTGVWQWGQVRGLTRTRTDGINTNAISNLLVTQRPGKRHNRAFGGGIV